MPGFILPIALTLLTWIAVKASRIGRRQPGLPPGPPTVPLLGNLHVFPKEFAHYRFTEWAAEHGEIYSLMLGPGVAVVLSSAAAIRELMDKRSGSTPDRPANYMAMQVAGGLNMVLAHYSDEWRTIRKAAHSMLTPQMCAKYIPIQRAESMQLMHDVLQTPSRTWWHLRRYSSSVILSVLYGKRAPRYETKETSAFFTVQHMWEEILEPGAQPPVDLLPFLKYVPERFASWKSLVRETRRRQRELYFGLLEECEARISSGTHDGQEAFMDEVVKRQEQLGLTREMTGYLGGVLIEGGSDTTSFFLQSLVLAITAFPDAQRRAHEEIDKVVGSQRLPNVEDFEAMPYIQALIKETHRFRPMAPLMIPHSALEDETYGGYLVPKGATIFVNLWGVYHDPEVFDDPEKFCPERYLRTEFGTKAGVDVEGFRHTLSFGCGRRICPGLHLANNTLMINVMNLLWGFKFEPLGETPVDTWAYQKGILTGPEPFECTIKPRSAERAAIIERDFVDVLPMFAPYEERLSPEDKEWLAQTRH